MKQTIYKCDRCGVVLEDGVAKKMRNVYTATEIRYKLNFFRKWKNEDPLIAKHELCEKCRESFERWLNSENA